MQKEIRELDQAAESAAHSVGWDDSGVSSRIRVSVNAIANESSSPKDNLVSALQELMLADAAFRQKTELATTEKIGQINGSKGENESSNQIANAKQADAKGGDSSTPPSSIDVNSAPSCSSLSSSSASISLTTSHSAPECSSRSPSLIYGPASLSLRNPNGASPWQVWSYVSLSETFASANGHHGEAYQSLQDSVTCAS